MVDTGTPFTSIQPEIVKRLNLMDSIQPCEEDDYYEGLVKVDVCAYPTNELIAEDFCFYIREDSSNMLGLDFLMSSFSLLDLDPEEPKLHLRQMAKNMEDQELCHDVLINGIETEAMLDTGFCGFVSVTPEGAERLELTVDKVDEPVSYDTQEGMVEVEYQAEDVTLEGFGREMTGTADVDEFIIDVLVGMEFLLGAKIQFQEFGSFELTFPPRSDN